MPKFGMLNDNKGGSPLLDLNDNQRKGDVMVNRPRCKKCGESLVGRKYVALDCKECAVFRGVESP
jgi:hypothetical protein